MPLAQTIEGFETLLRRKLIRHWGVSNFDLADMRELVSLPGGAACATNQIWYSLGERGPEFELLPWQRVHQMPLMAYSPIDQGELADHPALRVIAQRRKSTPAQVALAWVLSRPGVIAIPKAAHPVHVRHNWQAQQVRLTGEDLVHLDQAFAPPRRRKALAMR